jgi:DNA-binding XRE family transcriptional regulator
MVENDASKMTSTQCRDARALLGLTQVELAHMTNLREATIGHVESGKSVADCLTDALQVTLLAAGIDFPLTSDSRRGATLRSV